MFSNISWSTYGTYVFGATALYYSYVLVAYFRKDIAGLIKGRQTRTNTRTATAHSVPASRSTTASQEPFKTEELFIQAMELADKIKGVFQEVIFQGNGKEELLYLLQQAIHQYPLINNTPFMVTLNQLIQQESERHELPALDADEINALWTGLVTN